MFINYVTGELLTKLDLMQYDLETEMDDFWSGDIRHVGIQLDSKGTLQFNFFNLYFTGHYLNELMNN